MQQNEVALKLLLFIDKRPSLTEQVQQIRQHLEQLQGEVPVRLEIIDVSEQPYLAEHFKLVATPALIRVSKDANQTLAGSDIISQLDHWWPRWQMEAEAAAALTPNINGNGKQTESSANSVTHSTEIIRLSDDIFRLKQLNAEMEAQLKFKNRIIAMLAHDLRNPLTAASIAVETLEMGYTPDGRRSDKLTPALTIQLLKHAKIQIRNINRMITDILQAARGPCAELKIAPQEVDLLVLCREVLEAIGPKATAKEQLIKIDIPKDLPHVYADIGQIRQVITNLLDNAVKYTPSGGQIDITALHRTNQKVQISIQDTGPGIPEENQTRIFEESFRLKRDRAKDGYGLGLSLCLRIVRAHYGQIWVDSILGEGSTFHFTLPVYRAYGIPDD
ncbi:MAG: histidine kinase [Cyanobacteria bacterium J06635_1]